MKKRNGFTTIELIVTITLTLIIMGFVLEVLFILKEVYISSGVRTELLIKQALMSDKINQDFINYEIDNIVNCGDECLQIMFNNGSIKELSIDREERIFKYGDFVTELIKDSDFGEPTTSNERIIGVPDDVDDTIIQIKIPITYPAYDEDFGINVIYQYDSRITNPIGDFSF